MFAKKQEIDMCNGPLLGKILLFAFPLMCSGVLQLFFNAADIVVVGRFAGDNSLAAVGSTASLINLITNLFIGFSVGANVVTARTIGSGQKERMEKIVQTAMLLSLVCGILMLAVGIAGAPRFLVWMSTPEEVLKLASLYLRIYFIGMPFMMIYNFGSAILRANGDTRRPLYYLMMAGVVNVVLNCVFVIVFKMDVAGVALATAISQGLSAFLIVRCLVMEQGVLHLKLKGIRMEKRILMQIIRIGLPAGLQGMVFSFSNVIIQSSVNSFGSVVMAGNSAAQNLEGFGYVAMNSFHQAGLSFNGQNVGAKKYDRVDRVTLLCLISVFITGILFGAIMLFFSGTLLGIYSTSPEVVAAGTARMKIMVTTYFLCGIMDVMPGCLRGMGYSLMPMIVSLLGSCALRIVWVATIFQTHHTIENLYVSYPISWALTFCVHIICFLVVRKRIREQ